MFIHRKKEKKDDRRECQELVVRILTTEVKVLCYFQFLKNTKHVQIALNQLQ